MEEFKKLVELVDQAKTEADKVYINENMAAGKRFYALLMEISRQAKRSREELKPFRAGVSEKRKNGA